MHKHKHSIVLQMWRHGPNVGLFLIWFLILKKFCRCSSVSMYITLFYYGLEDKCELEVDAGNQRLDVVQVHTSNYIYNIVKITLDKYCPQRISLIIF